MIRASTRGDGYFGEDITHNVKMIKNFPLIFNKDIDIEVRGEIYMSKNAFAQCNHDGKKS